MKYITATFVFLVFNASWQWWALMVAWMCMEGFILIMRFREEYKKQIKSLGNPQFNIAPNGKVMTKDELEAIWNNGYSVGVEHSKLSKH